MRKIFLPILATIITSAAFTVTHTSCTQEQRYSDTLDSVVIKPDPIGDTNPDQPTVLTATGKVLDGAMNSVFIEVAPDSAVEFSYSELDRNNSQVFENWQLDDTITIAYVKTTRGGVETDSVVSIKKKSRI